MPTVRMMALIAALLASSAAAPGRANHLGEGEPCALGNNGVGNGVDPQPPGEPPLNDPDGTSPGSPDAQGGQEPSDDTGRPDSTPPFHPGDCVQVPEPATWVMLGVIGGMISLRRRDAPGSIAP